MAYSKSLNPVNGTGSQTISALKEQVHAVRYGSLSHTHTDSITTDNSGEVSTTFEIPSGAATSVYMDFTTGTTYSREYGVDVSITANGVDHVRLSANSAADLGNAIMTASNGLITIYEIFPGEMSSRDIIIPIFDDFTGFGDIHVAVTLHHDPSVAGQVFSMTANYN